MMRKHYLYAATISTFFGMGIGAVNTIKDGYGAGCICMAVLMAVCWIIDGVRYR